MKQIYKAGDITPLGELIKEYVQCIAIVSDGKVFQDRQRAENEKLIRATLNEFWVRLADMPGQIEVEDNDNL
jgi:hypothetical protein